MAEYDYVIVGAGPAGCVLTYRLSADPSVKVALIEAGPRDTHPFISMPKGLAKVMQDPRHLWFHASKPEPSTGGQSEVWVRGRVLGGSSSVNGMMYVRGQPADFDGIAARTSEDWSWEHIGQAYRALENHELGAALTRGDKGPLKISLPQLRDRTSDAQVAAGEAMGWARKADTNEPDDIERVGYSPRTIFKGKRQSAAQAFLRPVETRSNVTILTETTAKRVVFEGKRAVGVEVETANGVEIIRTRGEVILCGGAMSTPGLLERSGVGQREVLEPLGVEVVHELPAVGEGLIEHRGIIVQWKLKSADLSQNREFGGWRLLKATAEYYLKGTGPMASAAYEVGGWFKSDAKLDRPDCQMLAAPYSFDMAKQRTALETEPGMNVVIYPLRPTSAGSIHIETLDPSAPAVFSPNYRSTAEDRASMIGALRKIREWAAQKPLQDIIVAETTPGPAVETDDQIMDAYDRLGTCGYHAVGSCRMGNDPESVVDPQLRVRGVDGLRIMDTSILPSIPSGNTNGPVMAMAWRAADVIRNSKGRA